MRYLIASILCFMIAGLALSQISCSRTIPVGTYDYCVRLEVVDKTVLDRRIEGYSEYTTWGQNIPMKRPVDFRPKYYLNIIGNSVENVETAIHEEKHAIEGVMFGNNNRVHKR